MATSRAHGWEQTQPTPPTIATLALAAASAAAAAAALVAAAYEYSAWRRRRRRIRIDSPQRQQQQQRAKVGAKDALLADLRSRYPSDPAFQDDIVDEHLTRNIQLFGARGQHRIRTSFVIVVGLGGVGSHAAHMLARSGVGRIRLIDFDQVTLSSLNRHAVATRGDVGLPKALCLQRHLEEIFPEATIEAIPEMFCAEAADSLLAGQPDYVLDCIDNIDTKIALLKLCCDRSIRVLSATGSAGKVDPSRVRIADLAESVVDPLARAVRKRLKNDFNIQGGITLVLSTEKPVAGLVGRADEDLQLVPGFRVRTIPVLGPIPAIFGMVMASMCLNELGGIPVLPEPLWSISDGELSTLLRRLVEREELLYGTANGVLVDLADIRYLVREIWNGRSVFLFGQDLDSSDASKGLSKKISRLHFSRWCPLEPANVHNLILSTLEEADKLESVGGGFRIPQGQGKEIVRDLPPGWAEKIERRLTLSATNLGLPAPDWAEIRTRHGPREKATVPQKSNPTSEPKAAAAAAALASQHDIPVHGEHPEIGDFEVPLPAPHPESGWISYFPPTFGLDP